MQTVNNIIIFVNMSLSSDARLGQWSSTLLLLFYTSTYSDYTWLTWVDRDRFWYTGHRHGDNNRYKIRKQTTAHHTFTCFSLASKALFYYTLWCISSLQTMMQETTQFYLSRQETLTLTLCILLTLNLKVTLQNTTQLSLLFSDNILSLWWHEVAPVNVCLSLSVSSGALSMFVVIKSFYPDLSRELTFTRLIKHF